jgi:hypothetical protein
MLVFADQELFHGDVYIIEGVNWCGHVVCFEDIHASLRSIKFIHLYKCIQVFQSE